jgi:hypothetical protein
VRGTTLAKTRAMLKRELGIDPGTNADLDLELNGLLEDRQQWLSGEFDWPFLEHRWSVNCPSGEQFIGFPTSTDEAETMAINFDRPYYVEVFYVQQWEPLYYGIGSQEYNVWDSYLNERNDPIQRWMFHDDADFEVWPLPVTAQVVRFTAKRNVVTLRTNGSYNDSAVLDLDDLLVVYFTAAERLLRNKQADASAKLQLAQERMRVVRATYPSRARKLVLGSDKYEGPIRKVVPLITVGGTTPP